MQDTKNCPICGDKMRSITENNKFTQTISQDSYIKRTCHGHNHIIQFFTNENTKNVDFIKLSLSVNYSKFITIDFLNNKSQIQCLSNSKKSFIDIPKIIEPDFPSLKNLKEKVSLLITFS